MAAFNDGTGPIASNKRSLYLGYPCSVDAGVDPVDVAKGMVGYINKLLDQQKEQEAQQLREDLCKLIPGSSADDSNDQLYKKAEELRKPWGYTVYEDKTMMKDDMELVANCSDTMDFISQDVNKAPFLQLRVINEIDNLRITDVQSFLSRIQDPQDGTI